MALSSLEMEALRLSLQVALWAIGVSLPLGIAMAWVLARKTFPGRILLDGIVHLPLIVPPVVVGYLLLVIMGRRGLVGAWLWDTFQISIAFSWQGAAAAAGVMAFPLLVRSIRQELEAVDPKLEQAACTLGARPFVVFVTVTLPLIVPGILTGTILAFARCLGEFGA
ncbi:MAG: ABC transporter permease subunit, partial [Rhodospirillales bacterium]|nr:ABC transporter permease subunit [Rhodospirillales bacterium]